MKKSLHIKKIKPRKVNDTLVGRAADPGGTRPPCIPLS